MQKKKVLVRVGGTIEAPRDSRRLAKHTLSRRAVCQVGRELSLQRGLAFNSNQGNASAARTSAPEKKDNKQRDAKLYRYRYIGESNSNCHGGPQPLVRSRRGPLSPPPLSLPPCHEMPFSHPRQNSVRARFIPSLAPHVASSPQCPSS